MYALNIVSSVYHVLNQFSPREGARVMVGEGWLPTQDLATVRTALETAGARTGCSVQPALERIHTRLK